MKVVYRYMHQYGKKHACHFHRNTAYTSRHGYIMSTLVRVNKRMVVSRGFEVDCRPFSLQGSRSFLA
jgi:hypothetical protein